MPNYVFGYGRDSAFFPLTEQEAACHQWFLAQTQQWPKDTGFTEGSEWAGFYEDPRETVREQLFLRPAGEVLLQRLRPGDCVVVAAYNIAVPGRAACEETARIIKEREAALVILDWPEFPAPKNNRSEISAEAAGLDPRRARRYASYGWTKLEAGRRRWTTLENGKRGIKKNIRWVENEHDRDVARLIVALHDEHGLGWPSIYKYVQRNNVRLSSGKVPSEKSCRNAYFAAKAGFPILSGNSLRNRPSGDRALRPPSLGVLERPSGSSGPSPP